MEKAKKIAARKLKRRKRMKEKEEKKRVEESKQLLEAKKKQPLMIEVPKERLIVEE